ncbi:hypothetical protein NicSoilB11_39600 [Arthrobacter sp. NicSoilB11]|jgi:hypothetical protein|nr:hypothetical protein StoSoilB19_39040 [Arthrobacter sp. StoSoilB19]BCW77635.1 hypothetical protein NicSoilB11_39600 [Arthrobacter sp. NicSoilB11]
MVPGNPASVRGLINSWMLTTTGGWKTSVSHLAVWFLARIEPLLTVTSWSGP